MSQPWPPRFGFAHLLATLLAMSITAAPRAVASAVMDSIAADPSLSLFNTALTTLLPPDYLAWISSKDGESNRSA